MSTTTTNLGLIKPERSDNYSCDVMSENMDVIDGELQNHKTRITAVENEVNGALNCTSVTADTVTADLSPCFDVITDTTNEIGSIRFATDLTLVNGGETRVSKTYTYRANPFNNTVIFTCYAINQSSSNSGDASVKVNDIIVCNAAVNGNTTQTKTATVTLNEGDVIYATAYSRTAYSYVKMTNNIYVIKS